MCGFLPTQFSKSIHLRSVAKRCSPCQFICVRFCAQNKPNQTRHERNQQTIKQIKMAAGNFCPSAVLVILYVPRTKTKDKSTRWWFMLSFFLSRRLLFSFCCCCCRFAALSLSVFAKKKIHQTLCQLCVYFRLYIAPECVHFGLSHSIYHIILTKNFPVHWPAASRATKASPAHTYTYAMVRYNTCVFARTKQI